MVDCNSGLSFLALIFSDVMVHISEQQTEMVSDAEIGTLCVQEAAIVDNDKTRGTVDPHDIRTQASALSGSGLLGNPHPFHLLSIMNVLFVV